MIKLARVNLVLALAGMAAAVAACGGPAPASQATAAPAPVATRASAPTLTPTQVATAPSPGVMVDSRGMTIYSYDRDQTNRSNCTGRCAQNWRPVVAQANAAHSQEWTTVNRADGSRQWAYQGRPLYTWVRDRQAGDVTGDGMDNGNWHVVRR